MEFLDFRQQSLMLNIGIFAACTVVVWLAGWNIAKLADRFASAAGIGHAIAGTALVMLQATMNVLLVAVALAIAVGDRAYQLR